MSAPFARRVDGVPAADIAYEHGRIAGMLGDHPGRNPYLQLSMVLARAWDDGWQSYVTPAEAGPDAVRDMHAQATAHRSSKP